MQPKISIVTINFNMAADLDGTIRSVVAQTYPNLEYLVIDGGSTDGSVEVIRKHAKDIDYWVSERDRGLYHAMNKGTQAATGEWVLFMNSGDRFADPGVVADVFVIDRDDADLVFGHSIRRYEREHVEREIPAEPVEVLPYRMNCSHQSIFARRQILLDHPFTEGFMSADYEFLVAAWSSGLRFKLVDRVVGAWTTGGMSDRKRILSLNQRIEVLERHGLMTPSLRLTYFRLAMRALAGQMIRRILPMPLLRYILRYKPVAQGR
jgi:glycosyltransferase involved in cell wall biosynthesis